MAPRWRLYRSVVAGATGRVGEVFSRQLLLSPLCEEVHAVGRRETHAFNDLAAAGSKLRQHRADMSRPLCDVDASALTGVHSAFCLLGARGGWADAEDVAAVERDGAVRFAELCAAAGVPHITLVSSAWADRDSRMPFARIHAEAAEAYTAISAFRRISIFRPGTVLDGEGRIMGPSAQSSSPAWAGALRAGLPLAWGFLPKRFRPITLSDLALALRLNTELCDSAERVEMLDYRDIMMIIGRDSEV
mmetsp:Transcript_22344/g.47669  ORF Transcript_22344/g.47669 Transcript_22344/m.47669 type:complete len:247 (+) Transcript_22344:74-814(+)